MKQSGEAAISKLDNGGLRPVSEHHDAGHPSTRHSHRPPSPTSLRRPLPLVSPRPHSRQDVVGEGLRPTSEHHDAGHGEARLASSPRRSHKQKPAKATTQGTRGTPKRKNRRNCLDSPCSDLHEIHNCITREDERNVNSNHENSHEQVQRLQYLLEEKFHGLKDGLARVRKQCTEDVRTLRSRLDSLEVRVDRKVGEQEPRVLEDSLFGDRMHSMESGPNSCDRERGSRMNIECVAAPSENGLLLDYTRDVRENDGVPRFVRGPFQAGHGQTDMQTICLEEGQNDGRGCMPHRISALERQEHGPPMALLECETTERYCFGSSTWDIAGLVGVDALGVGGFVVASLAILIKVLMQLIFIGITYFNFTSPPINQDVVDAAKAWRRKVGHQAAHLDAESGHSLVARVCAGDMSLEKSGSQANLYKNVGDYLKPDAGGFEAFFDGQALCLVAITCWYLMVSKDIHDALNWFRALATLPRTSKNTEIAPCERPRVLVSYTLMRINRWRLRCCMLVLIYRLFVAAALLYCGTCFLVYTIEITELVLNAVALEIILNIDELIFDSLTTSAMRNLVHKLEPIVMDRLPHWKGVDAYAFAMNFLLPLSLVIVYASELSPMVSGLNAVEDALCGGGRDFVWVEDALQMVWMAPTKAYADSFHISSSAGANAVLEAVGQVRPESRVNPRYAMWKHDTKSLELQGKYQFSQALEKLQPSCQDFPPGPELNYMRDLVNVTIESCADVKPWCTSVSVLPDRKPDNGKGILARALCPLTCGCADPSSSIFVHTGCPSYCTSDQNPTHLQSKNQAKCSEKSPSQLRESSMWMSWVSQVRTYAASADDTGDARVAIQVADLMEQNGCQAVPALSKFRLYPCWHYDGHDFPFRVFGNACPQSCDCGAATSPPLCPQNCSHVSNQSHQPFP